MRICVLGAAAVATVGVLGSMRAAEVATPHYANCTNMHAKYKDGIASEQ